MRIAAIDIGTNSVHMIVVQVRPDRSFEVVDREKEMVRLGSGGLGGRALTEAATADAVWAELNGLTNAAYVGNEPGRASEASPMRGVVAKPSHRRRMSRRGVCCPFPPG